MALVRSALDASWAIRRGILGWLFDLPRNKGSLRSLKNRIRYWWQLRCARKVINEIDRSFSFRERLDP